MTAEDSTTESSKTDAAVLKEVPAVEMNVGYLPDGLIDNSAEKGGRSYKQPDEQGGFFIGNPLVMDTSEFGRFRLAVAGSIYSFPGGE